MPDPTQSDREPDNSIDTSHATEQDPVAAEAGDAGSATPQTDSDASPREGLRRLLLVILAVLLVIALCSIGVRFFDSDNGDKSFGKLGRVLVGNASQGDELASRRDEVMRAADTFVDQFETYGPSMLSSDGKTMPGYRKRVQELMTAKFGEEFISQGVPYAESAVSQSKVGSSARIYASGVAGITDDTASVLVVGQTTNDAPKSSTSSDRVVINRELFRYRISLVLDHGQWLVDDLEPATQSPTPSLPGAQGGK